MRIRIIVITLLCALFLPAAANAAGFSGYCAQTNIVAQDRSQDSAHRFTPLETAPRASSVDPLLQATPVAQYACSNRCRRGCYAASQSCRASARTCRRRLSACIRRCGC